MKILYFGGGLGNQIFEYAFYLSVKDRFPNEKIWGVYESKRFEEHEGGFEIEKVFNVAFPKASLLANIIMFVIMAWNKCIHKTSRYCHNLTKPDYTAWLFNAQKMNKSFYEGRKMWISYKHIDLDERNQKIIDMMQKTDSVSIHVRRGDFFSAKYAAKHVGVATENYYKEAIKIAAEKLHNPIFFVFSDDIPWCRENLNLRDSFFVDWNTGQNSYIDMYLMGHSKINIIANSTFSYWGAYFNKNATLVIYPERWKFSESKDVLDIFPANWLGLQS